MVGRGQGASLSGRQRWRVAVEFLDSVEGAAMRAHSRNDGYLDLRIHDRDECGDKLHRAIQDSREADS